MPSVHDVLIERHSQSALSYSTDWPHAALSIDQASGKITLTAPYRFPIANLPVTFEAADIQRVEVVHVGDFAIRLIAFVIFLGIPYSITQWITGRDWEIIVTIFFVGLDFLFAASIHRWLALPAIRIIGTLDGHEHHEVKVMASGISPLKTISMAQEIVDVLISHHHRGFTPDLGSKEYWNKIQKRMIWAFALASVILVATGISVFLSDLLNGAFVIP